MSDVRGPRLAGRLADALPGGDGVAGQPLDQEAEREASGHIGVQILGVLANGSDPEVRALATAVIAAQEREIVQLRSILTRLR